MADVQIRHVSVAEIIPVRHEVLRAGLPVESAHFEEDNASTTHHFAAFNGAMIIGCATFLLNEFQGDPAWQLRGMAVREAGRNQGIGAKLLAFAEAAAQEKIATNLFWANARTPAASFYLRQGWEVVSEMFVIPTAGPHYRIRKRFARGAVSQAK